MELKSVRRIGRACWMLLIALAVVAGLKEEARADYYPAVTIGTAPLVSPDTTYYGSATTHTFRLGNDGVGNGPCYDSSSTSLCPPEIRELARALKGNVDLIYDYVHNNIDTVWMFGLQKGALGALIDKSGTPFDQAALMVELLRASGYAAGYKYGKVVLSNPPTSFFDATGISSATAACHLLANGGIPATVNGTTDAACPSNTDSLQSATFRHVWVWVTIPGASCSPCQFDPSFKPYIWKAAASGLPTLPTGPSSAFSQATSGTMTSGTTSGVPYVKSLNTSALNTVIQNFADSLLSFIGSNLPSGDLDDLIGGGTIGQAYSVQSPLRQTSLSNHTVTATWGEGDDKDIPNQFRATLRVNADKEMDSAQPPTTQPMFDRTFYVDEIYGRRLTIDTSYRIGGTFDQDHTTNTAYLRVDGVTVRAADTGTDLAQGPGTLYPRYYSMLELTANHPYAANSGAYMDATVSKRVIIVQGLTIINGWGNTSPSLLSKWTNEEMEVVGPLRHQPGWCENGTAPCPPGGYYPTPTGDLQRSKAAALWQAQFSRSTAIHAQLAGGAAQIHHMLGAVYSDDEVENMYGACPPGPPSQNNCYPDHDTMVANSMMQVDVDAGISVSTKIEDSGSALRRRAALHAIAATGAALEGAVSQELADLVDTSSTATRFGWANNPPSNPSGTNAGDPSGVGARKFLQFTTNVTGLVVFEGQTNPATDACFHATPGDGHPAKNSATFKDMLQSGIALYTAGGFTVVASEESFLGPGVRGGYYWTLPNQQPQYECGANRQRGGAFVATHYDGNNDPDMIAHIVSGFDANSKGGGGASPPGSEQQYDPKTAAEILRARFADRSSAMGVSLQNGGLSYSSPASISTGNGGFPYELSANYTWRNGHEELFGPQVPSDPGSAGWTSNWQNKLAISSSALEAMGQSDVRAAALTIAAFKVAQDIYSTTPSAQSEVAGVLTHTWWVDQLNGNVVTVQIGASSRQFLRTAKWGSSPTFISPGGSGYATLTQTGTRAAYEEYCPTAPAPVYYPLSRGWKYDGMSFVVHNANGDTQTFDNWMSYYAVTDESSCGRMAGFHLTNWHFPYGFDVNIVYAPSGLSWITSVSNTVGRQLDFTSTGIQDHANSARQLGWVTQGFVDPDGHETHFGFSFGWLKSNTQRPGLSWLLTQVYAADDPNRANVEYTYDTLGRVKEARDGVSLLMGTNTDNGGRAAHQFFIADGTRGERVDPTGQSYVVVYNTKGQAVVFADEMNGTTTNSTSDDMNRVTTAEYDGRGRVIRYTYPEGDCERFTYDLQNNMTSAMRVAKTASCSATPIDDSDHIVTTASWNSTWNKPASVTTAMGCETDFAYTSAGLLASATRCDPDGAGSDSAGVYSFTYNSWGQPVDAIDPDGVTTRNAYFTSGTSKGFVQTTTLDPDHIAATTTFEYDATGNIARTINPRGNVVDATYNLNRQKLTTLAHDGGLTAAAIAATRTTYDALGRATKEEAGLTFSGTSVSTWQTMKQIAYTRTGKPWRVIDADNRATRTYYDALDRPLTVSDPVGRQVHYLYCLATDTSHPDCAANQVRVEQRAYLTATQIDYATYTYGLDDEKLTVADADNNPTTNDHRTTYHYDGFMRLDVSTFPDTTHEDLTYNKDDVVILRTTRSAVTITYTPNLLDRVVAKAVPEGSLTRTSHYHYTGAGRPDHIWDETQTTHIHDFANAYDTAGRLTSVTRDVSPSLTGTQVVSYQYDVASNRTRITWPDSYYVQYGYDNLNRMTSASENGSFTLANFGYNSLSRRTSVAYAPSTGGATMAYSYSAAGDVATLNHDLSGGANDPHYTYTYSDAHQLASMALSDNNFRWQAIPNCGTGISDITGYSHNVLNQYTALSFCNGGSSTSPTHDANGNEITAGHPKPNNGVMVNWTYTYDPENRLKTASAGSISASYDYDSLGHRVNKNVGGVYTFFLGETRDDEIAEYSRDGSSNPVLLRRFIPGPGIDQPIAMVDVTSGSAVRSYFHTNRMGSVIAMSGDAAVRTEGPYTYDPYGFVCAGNGDSNCALKSGGEPFKFTGRRLDSETGLYYYRARYYSWDDGRFLQTDPVGYKEDLNLYAYVGNDPVDRTDPSGQVINAPDSRDRRRLEQWINSRARGIYHFNKDGNLERTGTTQASGRSEYYAERLDEGIRADGLISVSIAQTATNPINLKTFDVDKNTGGGATLPGMSPAVVISGHDRTGTHDKDGNIQYVNPSGEAIRMTPADILAHEFVGHAIPKIAGSDTGNAVANENKVRAETGGDERVADPIHGECGTTHC